MGSTTDKSTIADPPSQLLFTPVAPRQRTLQGVNIETPYGSFDGMYFPGPVGWLAMVVYKLGDVEIHRNSPTFPTFPFESEAVAWIEACYAEGPGFILALVAEVSNG